MVLQTATYIFLLVLGQVHRAGQRMDAKVRDVIHPVEQQQEEKSERNIHLRRKQLKFKNLHQHFFLLSLNSKNKFPWNS
jgi:alpha-D-ribose 1-methylphosphonate 5-triphosphate diphosphatase PhnM